jgi:hypothetical protein
MMQLIQQAYPFPQRKRMELGNGDMTSFKLIMGFTMACSIAKHM